MVKKISALSLCMGFFVTISCKGEYQEKIANTYLVGEWIAECEDLGERGSAAESFIFDEYSTVVGGRTKFSDRACSVRESSTAAYTNKYFIGDKVLTDSGYEALSLDFLLRGKVIGRTIVWVEDEKLYFGKTDSGIVERSSELDFESVYTKIN